MTQDREKLLEDRYILDFERSAQVRSRRNALLGNWIAIQTGRNDTAALTAEVLKLGHDEISDDELCDRLVADLNGWGITFNRDSMRKTMHDLLSEAAEQLASEDENPASD